MRGRTEIYGILIFLGFSAMFSCDTERNIENPDLHYFVRYYGGDGDQEGVDMVALSDGTFLLLGNSSTSASNNVIYVVRVDAVGEVLWEKVYNEGSDNNSRARDIEPTIDGNFVVLCDIEVGDSPSQLMLLKISPDGELLNSIIHGTPANDFSRTVTPLDDGGFIVSGTTELTGTWGDVNNPDPDLGDFFNYRFDKNFNVLTSEWGPVSPGFGGKFDVAVKAIERYTLINNKRKYYYYVFGHSNINLSNTNPDGKAGFFYFSRDSTGTPGGNYFPGNLNETKIHFVQEIPPPLGAGFLVVGTSQISIGVSEIFVARLRDTLTFSPPLRDFTFYSTFPLTTNIQGVAATSSLTGQMGFLLLGKEVRSTGAFNIWLSKIDQSGAVIWSSTFGSEVEDDTAAAVLELPDGKIVVLGTMGLADNQSKMAFIKLNPAGQLLK